MDNLRSAELKNVERYLQEELERETKFVLNRSTGACGISEVTKTEEDRRKLQDKLDSVRKQIGEIEGNQSSQLLPELIQQISLPP